MFMLQQTIIKLQKSDFLFDKEKIKMYRPEQIVSVE